MALIFLTAVILLFIYPLCHEAGHLITASLIGAEILDLGLFPTAHVDLAMPDSSEIKIMLIAMSGGIAPLILLMIPLYCNIYIIYYSKLTIALQSAVAGLTSMTYVLAGFRDRSSGFDDALKVAATYPNLKTAVVIILAVQILIALYYIICTHPLSRTVNYLKKTEKKPTV